MEVSYPTTIYCDNLSNIQLAKNPIFHALTKHIERVLSGEVELMYVPTDRQNADIFTKPLGLDKLQQFSGALCLRRNIHKLQQFSGEVELMYVPTDRQNADIFTKPLGLDKLRQFSGALGLRHLDVPNLSGRDSTVTTSATSS